MADDRALADARPSAMTEHAVNDISNPRSIINLVPDTVREAILRVPDEYLAMTSEELEGEFKAAGYSPNITDKRMRIAFWLEYDRSQSATAKRMNMGYVYGGLCSRQYFYERFVKDKRRMAWILISPPDYKIATEEALLHGVDRLREILDMPIKVGGKIDAKAAAVILETVKFLDTRVKGAVIQKIQQANLNVNVDASERAAGQEAPESMESLTMRLKELEAKSNPVPQLPRVVEAELVGDDE